MTTDIRTGRASLKVFSRFLLPVLVLAACPVYAAPKALGKLSAADAAAASETSDDTPVLVVTNKRLPSGGRMAAPSVNTPMAGADALGDQGVYDSLMTEAPAISPSAVMNEGYFDPENTLASQKIEEIRGEMFTLQTRVADLARQLNDLQSVGQELAANYYSSVATINTQLQSGTTPGNPRLMERLNAAQDALETLSSNVSDLNALALMIADSASVVGFLQESARAAYGLTGSVEEDHARLAQLEDSIANTSVLIERLMNNANDNISRSSAYLSSERSNLRTLSLAIANGDMYGRSLANRPFLSVQPSTVAADMAAARAGVQPASLGGQPRARGAMTSPRPLVVIKFDRPDVKFQEAVYQAVSEAVERYPNARFELVAVAPGAGNPARKAIESTRSRRNAERVLRTLTEMGLGADKVDLSSLVNNNIQTNEVHIYIR